MLRSGDKWEAGVTFTLVCVLCWIIAAGGMRSARGEPNEGGESRILQISIGKSSVLKVPFDITDVIIGNPKVADAVVRSRRHVYLVGIGAGETNAVLLGADNGEVLSVEVQVTRDLGPLQSALRDLMPQSRIRVRAVASSIVLTGEARTPADAANAVTLAERFMGKPESVVNLITVRAKEQVLLTVTVAEITRSDLQRFGVQWRDVALTAGAFSSQATVANAFAITSGTIAPASSSGGGIAAASGGTMYAALTGDTISGAALVEALERSGQIRILAEPNLTAISGETANFLAGGEFPIPVSREGDKLSVEWKSFGVGLAFTPVVLGEGRISLKISTEVSELTNEGAVQSAGLNIPAVSVRRVTSSVELPSGGAIVLAGLLSEKTRKNADLVPGLSKLPVLGPLFENRDFVQSQTELVVIVAAYLADTRSRNVFLPESRLGSKSGWAGTLEPAPSLSLAEDAGAFPDLFGFKGR